MASTRTRLLIATDAWHPQVTGVVRSLEQMIHAAPAHDVEPVLLTPNDFTSMPLLGYSEVQLCSSPLRMSPSAGARVRRRMFTLPPWVRWVMPCVAPASRRQAFTTSYHARFPEYLAARAPVPESSSYAFLRRFHAAAGGTMVSTPPLRRELSERGFTELMSWTRGVETDLFRPAPRDALDGLARLIFLFVGRLAIEKNLPPSCRSIRRTPRSWSATARTGPSFRHSIYRRAFSGR